MAGSVVSAYVAGKSIPQIADAEGMPRSTVRRTLVASGVKLRTRADAIRLASDRLGVSMPRPKSKETREKLSVAALARGAVTAVGVSLKPSGYVEHTRGEHKGRSVHVTTMEDRIGRRLLPDEVVHHVDGDRSNNNLNNLALMARAAHSRLHRREENIAKGQQ